MIDAPLAVPPEGVDAEAWAAASAAVRSYCGWHIAPSITETVTVDGSGGSVLLLPTLRLTNLADVVNDGQPVSDPEWSVNGLVRGKWTSKFRGITLTMTHGYDEPPPDVLVIVADMAKARALDVVGASTVQAGSFGITFGTNSHVAQAGAVGISRMQRSVLDRYKLPPRP